MRTTPLFGLDFVVNSSIEELANSLEHDGQTSESSWRVVVTPNVDHLIRYRKSPTQRQVAESAYMVLPDGAPIVWASRLLKSPIDQRLAGSDLFAAWWKRIVAAQRPVVIVASNEQLARELTHDNPRCRCIVPPMFADDDPTRVSSIVADVLAELEAEPADAVVLGLSTAKSHLIAASLTAAAPPRSQAPLVLLLGASAEFYFGQQQRAPKWVQRTGLEWFYRLVRDPRRLAKRYLVDDMEFFPMVWREWRSRRARR
ncbi:MAG: WecB/TagA/CpsF family glycosyltransferase [Actinomycetia bacterium]|nr:WecB/TagA/CpsF family glycosyltransferase [Actinomycetes bacterium]